jgi:hypothetical protein
VFVWCRVKCTCGVDLIVVWSDYLYLWGTVYVLIEVWSGPWSALQVGQRPSWRVSRWPAIPHFAGDGVESQRQPFGLVQIVMMD